MEFRNSLLPDRYYGSVPLRVFVVGSTSLPTPILCTALHSAHTVTAKKIDTQGTKNFYRLIYGLFGASSRSVDFIHKVLKIIRKIVLFFSNYFFYLILATDNYNYL